MFAMFRSTCRNTSAPVASVISLNLTTGNAIRSVAPKRLTFLYNIYFKTFSNMVEGWVDGSIFPVHLLYDIDFKTFSENEEEPLRGATISYTFII